MVLGSAAGSALVTAHGPQSLAIGGVRGFQSSATTALCAEIGAECQETFDDRLHGVPVNQKYKPWMRRSKARVMLGFTGRRDSGQLFEGRGRVSYRLAFFIVQSILS